MCLCVFVALNHAVCNYLFPMQSKGLELWWKCVYPPPHALLCAWAYFLCRPGLSSRLFAITPQQWRNFVIPVPNASLAWTLSWPDETWASPASNCPHHLYLELTNSASLQLAGRPRWDGGAARVDGIIKYVRLLLCLVQQSVARNSRSSDSVHHPLCYGGH